MTLTYILLALLAAAIAFFLGRYLGAQQREQINHRHEQEAIAKATAIRSEADTLREQVRAEVDGLRAEAQAEAENLLARAQGEAATERREARAEAEAQVAGLLARAEEQSREYAREYAEAERRKLEAERTEARAALDERKAQLRERRAGLDTLQLQLDKEREALETGRAELAQERASMKAEAAEERERLLEDRAEYRAEREALNRELERQSRRAEQLDARGERLEALEQRLEQAQAELQAAEAELEIRRAEIDLQLQEVAALTRDEARERILTELDVALEDEKAQRVRAAAEVSSKEIARRARHITAQAIQRSASETSAQLSVSVVPLPSDTMKGRLIGREGRNIRAFEALTGVDLIIDDTPEAVMLSSFNPVRREVARQVLSNLMEDGRIHPTRIEEMVERAQEDMRNFIHTQGEEAAIEAGVMGIKPGLLQLLGRMYFRTSYGQNVLKHSIQVAHLTGIMADELGLDAALARRCGLLHDIGKSIDREIEGTHVEIGISLGTRFGESAEVIDAIAHHHDPENGETLYSVLVAAADAISAARPGARREELEAYTRRLEQLEEIAVSFPGVQQAYAIQAGREVRVVVQPNRVSDSGATLLARDIARRIEADMEYPGQVQVTVVRESRAGAVAR